MGTSALPYIYRQSTSARGVTNMFYFSMQTYLLAKSLVVIPFSYIGIQVNWDFGIEVCQTSCDCGIQF